MATTSRTWFYTEPERRAYFIEERVNHSLWAARFGAIYMDCVRAEPPFKMEGVWGESKLTMEWIPNKWLKITTDKEDRTLVAGFAKVLQFPPTLSFVDEQGVFNVEWWREGGDKRFQEVQGHPTYTGIRTYKR
jgi:hypothetical protein